MTVRSGLVVTPAAFRENWRRLANRGQKKLPLVARPLDDYKVAYYAVLIALAAAHSLPRRLHTFEYQDAALHGTNTINFTFFYAEPSFI